MNVLASARAEQRKFLSGAHASHAHTRRHGASHEAMKREGKKKEKKKAHVSSGSNGAPRRNDDTPPRSKKRPRSSDAAAADDSSRVKNALRSAQLDKRELLLWR